MTLLEPKFNLGQIVITQNAMNFVEIKDIDVNSLILRHATGDWGDLSDSDKKLNDDAVKTGLRILSSYTVTPSGGKIWIITEHDRSVTTILLPSDH